MSVAIYLLYRFCVRRNIAFTLNIVCQCDYLLHFCVYNIILYSLRHCKTTRTVHLHVCTKHTFLIIFCKLCDLTCTCTCTCTTCIHVCAHVLLQFESIPYRKRSIMYNVYIQSQQKTYTIYWNKKRVFVIFCIYNVLVKKYLN